MRAPAHAALTLALALMAAGCAGPDAQGADPLTVTSGPEATATTSPTAEPELRAETGSILGFVRSANGTAIAGALVLATDAAVSERTGPDGAYWAEAVPAGRYELRSSAPGHADAAATIELAPGATRRIDFALRPVAPPPPPVPPHVTFRLNTTVQLTDDYWTSVAATTVPRCEECRLPLHAVLERGHMVVEARMPQDAVTVARPGNSSFHWRLLEEASGSACPPAGCPAQQALAEGWAANPALVHRRAPDLAGGYVLEMLPVTWPAAVPQQPMQVAITLFEGTPPEGWSAFAGEAPPW